MTGKDIAASAPQIKIVASAYTDSKGTLRPEDEQAKSSSRPGDREPVTSSV